MKKPHKQDLFLCSYNGCCEPATHRWDFNGHHFCSETHLILWVHKMVTQELGLPTDSKGGE